MDVFHLRWNGFDSNFPLISRRRYFNLSEGVHDLSLYYRLLSKSSICLSLISSLGIYNYFTFPFVKFTYTVYTSNNDCTFILHNISQLLNKNWKGGRIDTLTTKDWVYHNTLTPCLSTRKIYEYFYNSFWTP